MPTYTFDLLSKHFKLFQKELFQSWKHIQSATLVQFGNSPYIAEIIICSELPKPENPALRESFTSYAYITNVGDVNVHGADYFHEVKTWLRKVAMTT